MMEKQKLVFVPVFIVMLVCSIATAVPRSICQGRPTGYFVQDVTTCEAWFRCESNGSATRGFCTSGTHFDEPTQRCVWPSDSNCFRCPANNPFTALEVDTHCNQFVRCIDERPQHLECASGLLFDSEWEACNFANEVSCAANPPIQCPEHDDPNNRVFARDPNDCSRFFVCVNRRVIRRQCAPDLHFNPSTNQCDHPINTNCGGGSLPFTCPNPPTRNPPIYPHPTVCRQYITCNGQAAHHEICPPDTLFDHIHQRCDFVGRAICAPGAS